MPRFDDAGNCIGLTYASPLSLHRQVLALVKDEGLPMEDALKIMTVNPAAVLCKTGTKGCIAAGADADILVLDADMAIADVFARGRLAMQNGQVLLKGKFED
jgi:beta-aspartyl-dipeptidase (metallo-type)